MSSRQTVTCHPGLIRSYRERRGWTQLELAQRAGFSDRLIRKAELGEPVLLESVEIVAEALSDGTERLQANDLINDPMAVAQSFVRSYLAHGPDAALKVAHIFAPDVVLVIHSDSPEVNFRGEFRGVEGIDRMIRTALAQFEHVSAEFGQWFRNGSRVAALRRAVHRPVGAPPGSEFESWILHEYTVVNGLIARIDNYIDSRTWEQSLKWGGPGNKGAAQPQQDLRT